MTHLLLGAYGRTTGVLLQQTNQTDPTVSGLGLFRGSGFEYQGFCDASGIGRAFDAVLLMFPGRAPCAFLHIIAHIDLLLHTFTQHGVSITEWFFVESTN